MTKSKIEWTGEVWNPVRGCSLISPGCKNCYAMRQAIRQAAPGGKYEGLVRSRVHLGPVWTGDVAFDAEVLARPLSWRAPRTIFVNSMSDLFHESLRFEEIAAVFGVMAATPQHTYQVLTKRAKRMREFFEWIAAAAEDCGPPPAEVALICAENRIDIDRVEHPWPLPNVWLGVSVENQKYADERVVDLLRCPAAVRFVSYEPALGPVDFNRIAYGDGWFVSALQPGRFGADIPSDAAASTTPAFRERLPAIDWVIVGGESGPGARPFDVEWARSTVRACQAAGVAVFVKQLGTVPVVSEVAWRSSGDARAPEAGRIIAPPPRRGDLPDGHVRLAMASRKGGDLVNFPPDLQVREMPRALGGA